MELLIQDYNLAGTLIEEKLKKNWIELSRALEEMPLHVKASDQAGKQGQIIFDPVGTNASIKGALAALGWKYNQKIPDKYKFLGTDVDFVKPGVIVEVQFSNYPFLLNNILRSELFYKARTLFDNEPIEILIIITKAHMFPSSNSTLYFEQARNQLNALTENNVFDIPIRLVGLTLLTSNAVKCIHTTYSDARYSRTILLREEIEAKITAGKLNSRTRITR